jgi:hypothetical protein
MSRHVTVLDMNESGPTTYNCPTAAWSECVWFGHNSIDNGLVRQVLYGMVFVCGHMKYLNALYAECLEFQPARTGSNAAHHEFPP